MRSIVARLAVALAGVFVLTWRAHVDQDVVVAQTRNPIMVTRIYTGRDGQSTPELIELKLNGGASELIKAAGVQFSSRPPAPASDWHPGPDALQYCDYLGGRAELEMGDGKKVEGGSGSDRPDRRHDRQRSHHQKPGGSRRCHDPSRRPDRR